MKWPDCSCDIFEQFQVHIFTMPSSIEIELSINGSLVDLIKVQVPGEHVKALTCASGLVQRLDFSEFEYKERMNPRKRTPIQDEDEMKTQGQRDRYNA